MVAPDKDTEENDRRTKTVVPASIAVHSRPQEETQIFSQTLSQSGSGEVTDDHRSATPNTVVTRGASLTRDVLVDAPLTLGDGDNSVASSINVLPLIGDAPVLTSDTLTLVTDSSAVAVDASVAAAVTLPLRAEAPVMKEMLLIKDGKGPVLERVTLENGVTSEGHQVATAGEDVSLASASVVAVETVVATESSAKADKFAELSGISPQNNYTICSHLQYYIFLN